MTIGGSGEAGDCWNRIGVNGDGSCPELVEHIHCRNCPVFASAARAFFHRKAPAGYLEEWADLLGRPVAPRSGDEANLLVFRLGEEWLAVALGVVAEVTTTRPVHRVPHRSNSVFTGLVSLRGQLQLCVSLHGLLDVARVESEAGSTTFARLVVLRASSETWAFEADEVAGVRRVPAEGLKKVPSTLANPAGSFGRAVFAWDEGRSVDVLDEPRVFAALRTMGA